MNNSDEYEYDEYGYIIATGDCVTIPVDKIHTAPPNPLVRELTHEEAMQYLKDENIVARMRDPGVADDNIEKSRTKNN